MKTLKKQVLSAAAAVVLLSISAAASAAVPVYSGMGKANPVTYSFTAEHTGDIVAYFAGADASYANTISLLVNGVDTNLSGLNNQTASYGNSLNFGSVKAGDALVFRLNVLSTGNQWFSEPALNRDGISHVFAGGFGGDVKIPAGTYVGFEDTPASRSDYDYDDLKFVFTNVAVQAVPEPETYGMLMAGLGVLGFVASRRKRAAK